MDIRGFRARTTRQGRSIAQRSQRARRGIGVGGARKLLDGLRGFEARTTRQREEHRTEVSEVTEGGWGRRRKLFNGHPWLRSENHTTGIASHRGLRGGLGVGGESCSMDARGFGARTRANGRSIAQRSQRSQRGMGSAAAKAAQWTLVASGREPRANGGGASHRGLRGHRGGMGVGGESCSMDTRGFGARTTRQENGPITPQNNREK